MAHSKSILGIHRLFLISLMLLVMGCSHKSASLGLQDTMMQYERAVRWSDFILAAEYLDLSDPEKAQAYAAMEGVKVTDYQVRTTSEDPSGQTYSQLVEIQFYREPSIYQQKLMDRQQWAYSKEKQRWFLTSGLPVFQQAGATHP